MENDLQEKDWNLSKSLHSLKKGKFHNKNHTPQVTQSLHIALYDYIFNKSKESRPQGVIPSNALIGMSFFPEEVFGLQIPFGHPIFWKFLQKNCTWALVDIVPKAGDGIQLSLQLTSSKEPKRHHIDLITDNQNKEVERLVSIGTSKVKGWNYEQDADYVVLLGPNG